MSEPGHRKGRQQRRELSGALRVVLVHPTDFEGAQEGAVDEDAAHRNLRGWTMRKEKEDRGGGGRGGTSVSSTLQSSDV
jgi:hypothetical protein